MKSKEKSNEISKRSILSSYPLPTARYVEWNWPSDPEGLLNPNQDSIHRFQRSQPPLFACPHCRTKFPSARSNSWRFDIWSSPGRKTTKLAGLRFPRDVSCKAGWGLAKHQTSQVHHEASRLSSSACAIKCDVPVPFVLRWSETIYKPQDFQNTAKHISESYLHLQSVCFAFQSGLSLASLRIEVPHWCLQQDRKELAALHDVANQVCSVLVVFSCFQPDLLHLSSSSLKKIRIVRVGSTHWQAQFSRIPLQRFAFCAVSCAASGHMYKLPCDRPNFLDNPRHCLTSLS